MTSYWTADGEGEPFINCGHDAARYFRWHREQPEESDWYLAKTGIGFQVLFSRTPAGVRISTVYLGMDHGFGDDIDPVLWETIVFSSDSCWSSEDVERYTSLERAKERHIEIARLVAAEGLEALRT